MVRPSLGLATVWTGLVVWMCVRGLRNHRRVPRRRVDGGRRDGGLSSSRRAGQTVAGIVKATLSRPKRRAS